MTKRGAGVTLRSPSRHPEFAAVFFLNVILNYLKDLGRLSAVFDRMA